MRRFFGEGKQHILKAAIFLCALLLSTLTAPSAGVFAAETAVVADVTIAFSEAQGGSGSNTNAMVACDYLDGAVVEPGEVFSYNRRVGERSTARGFVMGTSYSGGKIIKDVGGGICKTSTMLYNACLRSGMEILERYPHSMRVNYVPGGLDAAVVYGMKDFRFRNTKPYAVTIRAVYDEETRFFEISFLGDLEEVRKERAEEYRWYKPYSVKTGSNSFETYVASYTDGRKTGDIRIDASSYMGKGRD